jgi:hypothetical protein
MKTCDFVLSVALAATALSVQSADAERLIQTPTGTCIEGSHRALKVRRLPGTPATSEKPRDPTEEQFVRCSEATADETPANRPSTVRPSPERDR